MSLTLVAIPIGDPKDLTIRAKEVLESAEQIIVEERKAGAAFLRSIGISGQNLMMLNEHSTPEDILELTEICKTKKVALISDCGTPGFCDPGAHLIKSCRKNKIEVNSVPGASSLMLLLSLSSERLDQFVFRGFLPVDKEEREIEFKKAAQEKRALVIMDTPYRLQRTLDDLKRYFGNRKVLLCLNLTQADQFCVEGRANTIAEEVSSHFKSEKAEFMVLVYPNPK